MTLSHCVHRVPSAVNVTLVTIKRRRKKEEYEDELEVKK